MLFLENLQIWEDSRILGTGDSSAQVPCLYKLLLGNFPCPDQTLTCIVCRVKKGITYPRCLLFFSFVIRGCELGEDHLGLMLLVGHGLLVLADLHHHCQGDGEVVSDVCAATSQSQVGVPPTQGEELCSPEHETSRHNHKHIFCYNSSTTLI